MDGGRATEVDLTGFIGLSSLTFKGELFLTEGVSDFITVKHLTGCDTLGQTTLNLNVKQVAILREMNQPITLVVDNDTTGLKEAYQKKFKLTSQGLSVKIVSPTPYKDITESWMNDPEQAKRIL